MAHTALPLGVAAATYARAAAQVNVFWKDAEMPDGLFSNKDLYGNQ